MDSLGLLHLNIPRRHINNVKHSAAITGGDARLSRTFERSRHFVSQSEMRVGTGRGTHVPGNATRHTQLVI